jgi:hypothetical protein
MSNDAGRDARVHLGQLHFSVDAGVPAAVVRLPHGTRLTTSTSALLPPDS